MNDTIGATAAEVGQRIDGAARGLHEIADDLRARGGYVFSGLADEIAYKADGVARYLRECDTAKLIGDAERLARKAPLPAAAVAAVGGFALSRVLKTRLGEEGESAQPTLLPTEAKRTVLGMSPLALAIGTAAVGLLAGLVVPPTQLETEGLPAAMQAARERGRQGPRNGSGSLEGNGSMDVPLNGISATVE